VFVSVVAYMAVTYMYDDVTYMYDDVTGSWGSGWQCS
jgi:hypothetical protein